MSYYMMITTSMYLLLFRHYVLVEGPVNSMLSHHGVRHVMEKSYESFFNHMYGLRML